MSQLLTSLLSQEQFMPFNYTLTSIISNLYRCIKEKAPNKRGFVVDVVNAWTSL
jgi:hypothetical protein